MTQNGALSARFETGNPGWGVVVSFFNEGGITEIMTSLSFSIILRYFFAVSLWLKSKHVSALVKHKEVLVYFCITGYEGYLI